MTYRSLAALAGLTVQVIDTPAEPARP